MNRWIWIGVLLVLTGASGAPRFIPRPDSPFYEASWELLGLLFVFGIGGVLFVVGIQTINPWSALKRQRPAWRLNPFNLQEPLQFLHMASFHFMVAGVVAMLMAWIHRLSGLEPLIPVAGGVGAWVGVWLCVVAFRRKMA